jgi:hypothetical protein
LHLLKALRYCYQVIVSCFDYVCICVGWNRIVTTGTGASAAYTTQFHQRTKGRLRRTLTLGSVDPVAFRRWMPPGSRVDVLLAPKVYDIQSTAGLQLIAHDLTLHWHPHSRGCDTHIIIIYIYLLRHCACSESSEFLWVDILACSSVSVIHFHISISERKNRVHFVYNCWTLPSFEWEHLSMSMWKWPSITYLEWNSMRLCNPLIIKWATRF